MAGECGEEVRAGGVVCRPALRRTARRVVRGRRAAAMVDSQVEPWTQGKGGQRSKAQEGEGNLLYKAFDCNRKSIQKFIRGK